MLWIKHVASFPGQDSRRPQHPGVGPPKATHSTLSKARFTTLDTSARVRCPRQAPWASSPPQATCQAASVARICLAGKGRGAEVDTWCPPDIALALKKGYLCATRRQLPIPGDPVLCRKQTCRVST